jgi:hypothetical protein
MVDPIDSKLNSISGSVAADKDSLKHWIRELTHLSPQQIEDVLAHRDRAFLGTSVPKQYPSA